VDRNAQVVSGCSRAAAGESNPVCVKSGASASAEEIVQAMVGCCRQNELLPGEELCLSFAGYYRCAMFAVVTEIRGSLGNAW